MNRLSIIRLSASVILVVSPIFATACPPDCGACYYWDGDSCEWDCGEGSCCEGECCYTDCCFGRYGAPDTCCNVEEDCCFDSCCSNTCCLTTCCEAGQNCCNWSCCSNACCSGTCCDPGETCCSSSCCISDCCSYTGACCGNTGQVCCDDRTCYDPNTQKCCGDGDGKVCDIDEDCCNGTCCPAGDPAYGLPAYDCCDGLTCYDPTTQKCCEDGLGTVCDIDEDCCDDGTCGLCCWTLEHHPQGEGTCECIETTGNCTTGISAWSIDTCERSASGSQYCGITYRQIGSTWACVESADWVNEFLCYGGQAAECVGICSWGAAECIASGFDPSTCSNNAISCYECAEEWVEGDLEDCGCLIVRCSVGDVTHILRANAGTLSGPSCP